MLLDGQAFETELWLKGSYRWIDMEAGEDEFSGRYPENSYLVVDPSRSPLSEARSYRPFDIPNLFTTFARLEPTKESILLFAEKFGELGVWVQDVPGNISSNRKEGGYRTELINSEPFSRWCYEIEKFSEAYRIWIALKRNDMDELRAHSEALVSEFEKLEATAQKISENIKKKYGHLLKKSAKFHEIIWGHTSVWPKGSDQPDPIEWARFSVGFAIQDGLTDRVNPKLTYSDGGIGIALSWHPVNLIGVIWLQFANAVINNERWKLCGYCGTPFAFKSAKAQYCSTSHRQLAYLKRQEAQK